MCSFLRRVILAAGLGALITAVGCGSSSSTQPQIRVLLAAPNAPVVNVLIDSNIVSSSLGYAANTGYLTVNSGQRHLQLEPVNSSTPILDQTLSLTGTTETTVIAEGLSAVNGLVLADDNTAPAAGTAMLRVVNAAPSIAAADVYVVAAGSSLSGLAATVPSLTFGSASSYQSVTIPTTGTTGSFEVLFTEPGTSLTFLSTGPISLTSGQNRTVVALNGQSGNITSVVLADLN